MRTRHRSNGPPSTTYRLSTSWARHQRSRTEVSGSFPTLGVPCWFPKATGANPTLTIMANAWRVAEHIADQRGQRDD